MHHFDYSHGTLYAENVAVSKIAEAVGTPFYCYSSATLERHYNVFRSPFPDDTLICYSVKANSNTSVIATLARQGAGADIVSVGELRRARAAGIPANKIVFSGVGKQPEELAEALDEGIYQFNVESEAELHALSDIAVAKGTKAPVALRVNPDVDAKTHAKITTGRSEDKFGIAWDRAEATYKLAGDLPGIEVVGIDVHIGSQITELEPFESAFQKVAELVTRLRDQGHTIARLDLGGGLGIPYKSGNTPPPHPDEYAAVINRTVGDLKTQIIFEPGRLIAGNAGILVSKVVYTKDTGTRSFLILDSAMNDLIRPALYDAHHDIIPVQQAAPDAPRATYDVVGPVCETADTFAKGREMQQLQSGDLVAFLSAGAYGAVQAGTYNTRPLIPEVLVCGDRFSVVRPRPSLDALLALDVVAPWLEDSAKPTYPGP